MLLPSILSAIKYYEENGDPKGDKEWDIERLNNIPQQTNKRVSTIFSIPTHIFHDIYNNI